jgi:hypothetical protein
MIDSPNFGILGRLGNAMRRLSGGGRSLELESEERSESNGGGRETTTPNPRASRASIVSDSSNPITPKSHVTVDLAEVEGVEGVGGATRALTYARQAAANPPNGEALDSVDVVGLGLKVVQTVLVPRDSMVIRCHTTIDEESGVGSAYLGDSRYCNITWCLKRLPMASLPRVHRAIIETLGANWPHASSGWVLDGVDNKTKRGLTM